ncbi:MAG: proline-rich domain-containing protein [Chloroflexota bacterium]
METEGANSSGTNPRPKQFNSNGLLGLHVPQKTIMGLFLLVALVAFELFNFDTTRYALSNLLGDVRFAGVGWATILAIAFCAIDFAGLARLFTPERGGDEPTAVWYLMGAWLLGATMNAIMTWWAISLTLLTHDFGNEVLSREQLLRWVPFFVAVLVWLTRILFIGAISVAGEYMFAGSFLQRGGGVAQRPSPPSTHPSRTQPTGRPFRPNPNPAPMRAAPRRENGRRPPPNRPSGGGPSRSGMQAPGRPGNRPRR